MKRLAVAVLALTLFSSWAVSSQATTWHGEPAYVLHNHRAACQTNYYRETIRVKGKREVGCVYRVPVIAITVPPVSITQTPAPVIQNPVGNTAPATTVPAPTTTTTPPATTTTTEPAPTTTTQPLQIVDSTSEIACSWIEGFCTEYNSAAETTNAYANVFAGPEYADVSPQVGTVTFTSADHILICTAQVYSASGVASNNARCTGAGGPFEGPITTVYSGGSTTSGNTETVYPSASTVGGSN